VAKAAEEEAAAKAAEGVIEVVEDVNVLT
jgi:hypothetical protein